MAEVVARTRLPLTTGLNQINRSMGRSDLYPFVLGVPVIAKLAFVADLVAKASPSITEAGCSSCGVSQSRDQTRVSYLGSPTIHR